MSLTVAAGTIYGDPGTYDYWDSTLSKNPDAASQDNRGCAPGWATIYVQDSITGETVKVCRRLDAAFMANPAPVIAEETGPDWYDASIQSVASAAEQVVTGAGQVAGALAPFNWSLAALLAGAALILFAWKR